VNLDDERVMTSFLLRSLDEATRERVLDRLENDGTYFEAMAALEDDLILRWHHGLLPPADRGLFAKAYADSARRARVDETLALVAAARARQASSGVADTTGAAGAPPAVTGKGIFQRWNVAAAAVAVLAIGLSSLVYVTNRRSTPATPFRVTLSAVGQKSEGNRGYDLVTIPPGTTDVVLAIRSTAPPEGDLSAELQAREGGAAPRRYRPVVERTATGDTVTVSVSSADLADGDYVLTITADANPSEPVATQAFRVTRR
jgi:hypothetical protein